MNFFFPVKNGHTQHFFLCSSVCWHLDYAGYLNLKKKKKDSLEVK